MICQECYGRSGGTWKGSYNAAERNETKAWNTRKPMDRIIEKLQANRRRVKTGEDLEWNRAIYLASGIVKVGGIDEID